MRSSPLALLVVAGSVLSAGVALAQTAAPPPPAPAPEPIATAALRTADGGDAGTVTAFAGPYGVLMRVEGKGWPQGWHGVHLHAVGTCDGPGFTSAGAHVNHADADDKRPHGLLNQEGGPDLGDLQNIYAGADGAANAEVYLAGAGLGMQGVDLMDDDGLSFLVHANADDHVSQPIGGAGDRIACGVFQAAEASADHAAH